MKLVKFSFILFLLALFGCSSGEKGSNENKTDENGKAKEGYSEFEDGNSKSDSFEDELAGDQGSEENGANGADGSKDETSGKDLAGTAEVPDESLNKSNNEEHGESGNNENMQETQNTAMTGETGSYVVSKGDSLMLISFKLYGDYRKWRGIASMNQNLVDSNGRVAVGATLSYQVPASPFNWAPKGSPYLIKNGDTLGKISNKVYGTKAEWKSIWKNNWPLIRDPNLIFTGFTVYYMNKEDLMAGI